MSSKFKSGLERLIKTDFSWFPGGLTIKISIFRIASRLRGKKLLTETEYGEEMYVNLNDVAVSWDIVKSNFDRGTTEIIESIVSEGDNVFDIGANIGYYSVLISREIGEDGFLTCFEPEKTNYDFLRSNLEPLSFSNHALEKKAVSAKRGSINLSIDKYNRGAHTVESTSNSGIDVETTTIDRYMEESSIESLDFIKIDVEGHEGKVLEGGETTISHQKPKIILEFNDTYWGEINTRALRMLNKRGYEFYKIEEPSGNKEKQDVKSIVNSSGHFNLLCRVEGSM
jgi:FkbM family methyltransferase